MFTGRQRSCFPLFYCLMGREDSFGISRRFEGIIGLL